MKVILLTIQMIVGLFLILSVLLQRTGTDSLGGLGGGGGGILSSRAKSDFLTKSTVFFAIIFIGNSLILGNIIARESKSGSVIEKNIGEIENKQIQKEKDLVPIAE